MRHVPTGSDLAAKIFDVRSASVLDSIDRLSHAISDGRLGHIVGPLAWSGTLAAIPDVGLLTFFSIWYLLARYSEWGEHKHHRRNENGLVHSMSPFPALPEGPKGACQNANTS
jgi:hypothetical protein